MSIIFLLVIPMSITVGSWTAHHKDEIGEMSIDLAELLKNQKDVNTTALASSKLFYQIGSTDADEFIIHALFKSCYTGELPGS